MNGLSRIKALTFDTGGTVLDWHTGFRDAFRTVGQKHGIGCDWAAQANDLRRRSLAVMVDLGEDGPPSYNFDDAHKFSLDALLAAEGLEAFDAADRKAIAWDAPHSFKAWPDVQRGLKELRKRYPVVSFTLLSYRLVIDSSRANELEWDAILSCDGLTVKKVAERIGCSEATLYRYLPAARTNA